jgi:phage shock protein A
MSISSKIREFFAPDPEKSLNSLLIQIDSALADLKIRIAENIARSRAMQRQLDEEKHRLGQLDSLNEPDVVSAQERFDNMLSFLASEQLAAKRLQEIFTDLCERKKQLEFSLAQGLAKRKTAETINLIADLHKNFGQDMMLNNYLTRFSQESFKIEFTAESRLKIETISQAKEQL